MVPQVRSVALVGVAFLAFADLTHRSATAQDGAPSPPAANRTPAGATPVPPATSVATPVFPDPNAATQQAVQQKAIEAKLDQLLNANAANSAPVHWSMILMAVVLMILAGIIGGLVAYGSVAVNGKEIDRYEAARSLVLGIGAALLTPLFLRTVSSDLFDVALRQGFSGALLVFFGFALLAAVSARAFIQNLTNRVLIRETREQMQEMKSNVNAIGAMMTAPDATVTLSPAFASSVVASLSNHERGVLRFLREDTRYRFRSADAIAASLNLDAAVVRDVMAGLEARRLAASWTSGRLLYWGLTPDGEQLAQGL